MISLRAAFAAIFLSFGCAVALVGAVEARGLGKDAKGAVAEALALFNVDELARHRAGHMELRGESGRPEAKRRQARALLLEAARQGDEKAMYFLAVMLDAGLGGRRDQAGARALYARSRERLGVWYLGRMNEEGAGGPRDLVKARALYRQAGEDGQVDAKYDYARLLRAGIGGPADKAEARRLLGEVTEHCHGDGHADLAEMADRGEGGPRDAARAGEEYVQAVSCHNRFFRRPALPGRFAALPADTRRAIQTYLAGPHGGGYSGPIDGRWSPALARALKAID